jgi:hypothetical protein
VDLAQSLQRGTTAKLGISAGAATLSAAVTEGFSSNYRAAAEVKTVVQAVPFDPAHLASLIANAATINSNALNLPEQTEVDRAYMRKSAEIFEKVRGTAPAHPIKIGDEQ